jgi:hypothetical protein
MFMRLYLALQPITTARVGVPSRLTCPTSACKLGQASESICTTTSRTFLSLTSNCRKSGQILLRVAIALRSNPATTISGIVWQQVADSVLDAACLGPRMTSASHLIYCIQGWAMMLCVPCLPELPDSDVFRVHAAHAPSFHQIQQPTTQTTRPFMGILDVSV